MPSLGEDGVQWQQENDQMNRRSFSVSQRLEKALKADEADNIRIVTISGNRNYKLIKARNSHLDFYIAYHIFCLSCYAEDLY